MKHLLVIWIVALSVIGFAAGPASAGGWAVTTLDPVPRMEANQTIEVGFTIRQHGVTPVNPGGEVGIVFRSTSGKEQIFVAEATGEIGHYVAEVTLPEVGSWGWAVRQGWFAEQPLGTIDLADPAGSTAANAQYRWPGWARLGLPALALLFGAAAILDAGWARRRRVLAA